MHKKESHGYSPAATYLNEAWVGSVTSCISMKRDLLNLILPIPYEKDWITRADDCLVWGASLKLGYKCFLNKSLVKYRIHGRNFFYGKTTLDDQLYLRKLRIRKLLHFLLGDLDGSYIKDNLYLEFKALPIKTSEDLIAYIRILLRCEATIISKSVQLLRIVATYFKKK